MGQAISVQERQRGMATGQERSNPASKRKEKGSKDQPRHRGGGGIDPHLRKGTREAKEAKTGTQACWDRSLTGSNVYHKHLILSFGRNHSPSLSRVFITNTS